MRHLAIGAGAVLAGVVILIAAGWLYVAGGISGVLVSDLPDHGAPRLNTDYGADIDCLLQFRFGDAVWPSSRTTVGRRRRSSPASATHSPRGRCRGSCASRVQPKPSFGRRPMAPSGARIPLPANSWTVSASDVRCPAPRPGPMPRLPAGTPVASVLKGLTGPRGGQSAGHRGADSAVAVLVLAGVAENRLVPAGVGAGPEGEPMPPSISAS